jgi:hypothetical protein
MRRGTCMPEKVTRRVETKVMIATIVMPPSTVITRDVPVIRIAWYIMYKDMHTGRTAPPRLRDSVVSHT